MVGRTNCKSLEFSGYLKIAELQQYYCTIKDNETVMIGLFWVFFLFSFHTSIANQLILESDQRETLSQENKFQMYERTQSQIERSA